MHLPNSSISGPKERIARSIAFDYIIVLLLIICSASPLIDSIYKSIIIFFVLCFVLKNSISLKSININILLFVIFSFSISLVIDIYNSMDYGWNTMSGIYMIFSFISSIIIAKKINFYRFSYVFQECIWFLTIISLIFYGLFIVFPEIVNFGIDYKYYDFPGKTFVVYNFIYTDDTAVLRNSGFSSEPGVFQFFINMAMVLGFINKRIGVFRVFVYGLAIYTTYSTAGIIIFSLIILIKSRSDIRALAIFLVVAFNGVAIGFAYQHYESKILTDYAYRGRLDPTLNALDIFSKYPMGFGSIRYMEFLDALNIGSWDSYTQIMMRFGVTGLLMFLYFLGRLSLKDFAVATVIALSMMTNSLWFVPGVAMFLFFDHYHASPKGKMTVTSKANSCLG